MGSRMSLQAAEGQAFVFSSSSAPAHLETRWLPPTRVAVASSLRPSEVTPGASRSTDLAVLFATAFGTIGGVLSRRSQRRHRSAVGLQAGNRGRKTAGGGFREKAKPGEGYKGWGKDESLEPEDPMKIVPALGCTVKELAELLGKPVAAVITFFFVEKGKACAINDFLERDLCAQVADKFAIEILFDDEKVTTAGDRGFLKAVDQDAEPRPPVVTVMGHVDHGKTTLLDTIRKRSVAAGEAGGITQRIGAYTVEVGGQKATFIDTPGHEAFSTMRARGAQVTDIVILVVAADDGVMPQTREAIAHARAAEVPIIVAINKIDRPGADTQRTRQMLSEEGLMAEDWGGEIPMVELSAKNNINIEALIELVTLTAEVAELKAVRNALAGGVVLESSFEPERGCMATLLVQRGTLKIGDCMAAGTSFCRVKAMSNEAGTAMDNVGPSTAVQVIGFSDTPQAGDQFEVFPSSQDARTITEQRLKEKGNKGPVGFSGLGASGDTVTRLALILKTDAQGSIAAVKHMFANIKDSEYVNLRWVLTAAGPITDSDVELASTCPKDQRVIILGFNTTVSPTAEKLAKQNRVEVQNFKVIYELYDTIVSQLQTTLGQEEVETQKGVALVQAVFSGRDGKVAGSQIVDGKLTKGQRIKVFRDRKEVGQGPIREIRVFKEVVKDVEEGTECGFSIEGWDDWEKGDEARCYEVKLVTPELVKKKEVKYR